MEGIISAWGRILTGHTPVLSIEITRECPLRCPGCYAYGDDHLGGEMTLRQIRDFKGQELIDKFMDVVDRHRPLHVSIVGGEPLVRYRELGVILPELAKRGIHAQLVTSAVREIPKEWSGLFRLSIVVSIDGLQPEHDERRTPATYDRILKHIEGHEITVHCTITRQQVNRAGYIDEFLRIWSARQEVEKIWISYAAPPASPDECVFARTTTVLSADLKSLVTPCQYGGAPDCSQCGCIASAGMAAVARHNLFGFIPVGMIFNGSLKVGEHMRRLRPAEPTPA
jgi:organic radical activating enzyme